MGSLGEDVDVDDKREKALEIKGKIREFVETYCMADSIDVAEPVQPNTCHLCDKVYVRRGNLVRHYNTVHHITPPETSQNTAKDDTSQDYKHNYLRSALPLLLLRANHDDAIKYADGDRMERCHLFLLPYFKVTSCPKYAFATLELLTQLRCVLSPRLAFRLKWNRTANTKGGIGNNHPLDLDVEHENKVFKDHITTYRGEVTENIIHTVSRSVDTSELLSQNFEKVTRVKQQSGRHKSGERVSDVHTLVRQYLPADMFSVIPGRTHAAFPNHAANPLSSLKVDKMRDWMKACIKKHAMKHFYKY
jgi:hypothetical protein